MRRAALLALVVSLLAGCGGAASTLPPTAAAKPQRAELGWSESIGAPGAGVVFGVRSLEVRAEGWRATVSLTNRTSVALRLGGAPDPARRQYGLMLFRTGDHAELDRRNADRSLPAIRPVERYDPALPDTLAPGKTWAATISAPGPLVAGSWVRVVFGPVAPVGKAPKSLRDQGIDSSLVWITDHAYELLR